MQKHKKCKHLFKFADKQAVKKRIGNIICIICLTLGFICASSIFIAGIVIRNEIENRFVEVDATIVDIGAEDEYHYVIEFEYTYKNVDYRASRVSGNAHDVGEKIKIMIYRTNPEKVHEPSVPSYERLSEFFGILGAVLMIFYGPLPLLP